jgi:hypothetical protein
MIFCLEFANFGLNARNWWLILCFVSKIFVVLLGSRMLAYGESLRINNGGDERL